MKKLLPLVVLATLLSGCGADNGAPCQSFETAYNEADLRDKYLFEKAPQFNEALAQLKIEAEAAAEQASGDVKDELEGYAGYAGLYAAKLEDPEIPADTLDIRADLSLTRDDIVDSCEESGNPIELEEDRLTG